MPVEIPEIKTESALIEFELKNATAAIKKTVADMQRTALDALDLNAWIKQFPIASVFAGFASGTAAGAFVAPRHTPTGVKGSSEYGHHFDGVPHEHFSSGTDESLMSDGYGTSGSGASQASSQSAAHFSHEEQKQSGGFTQSAGKLLSPVIATVSAALIQHFKGSALALAKDILNPDMTAKPQNNPANGDGGFKPSSARAGGYSGA